MFLNMPILSQFKNAYFVSKEYFCFWLKIILLVFLFLNETYFVKKTKRSKSPIFSCSESYIPFIMVLKSQQFPSPGIGAIASTFLFRDHICIAQIDLISLVGFVWIPLNQIFKFGRTLVLVRRPSEKMARFDLFLILNALFI